MKTLIKTGLAVVALSLCLGGNALGGWVAVAAEIILAEKFKEGFAAFQRGDYAMAYRLWLPLANQGNAAAQNNLGVMYDKGQGVPQDFAEAMKWTRKAAGQGYASAQFNLALKYDKGKGVPQDYAEAVKWYRKAAEQGDAQAQNNVGVMYGKGQGVPQDYVQAHRWYNLAAATFTDKTEREQAASNRDLIARQMTPAQVAEAQKLAREWKRKSPALGK